MSKLKMNFNFPARSLKKLNEIVGHVLATVKTQIQIILAEYWCNFSWVENILNLAKNI